MPSTDRSTGRFRLLLPLGLTALVGFALLRTALLAVSWSNVELGAGTLARVYGTGALYDLAFLAYAAVPLVLYLMLAPQPRVGWAKRSVPTRTITQNRSNPCPATDAALPRVEHSSSPPPWPTAGAGCW